jgi:hypothetical protein
VSFAVPFSHGCCAIRCASTLLSPCCSPRALQVPLVLAIAGSDSGGGAGVQADIKTCMASGVYATTAVTALTAQASGGLGWAMARWVGGQAAGEAGCLGLVGSAHTHNNCGF